MLGKQPPRKHESLAAAMGAFPDVTRIHGHTGQVLLYPHHLPAGVYVVLAGAVRRDGNRVLDAQRGAFLIPTLDDLDRPAATGFTIARDTDMYFIPRSLALQDDELRRMLEKAGLAGRTTA